MTVLRGAGAFAFPYISEILNFYNYENGVIIANDKCQTETLLDFLCRTFTISSRSLSERISGGA